jgi:hypothetical protein
MSIEKGLMAGPTCQAGWGKDGTAVNLGQVLLLQRRRLKKLIHV